jgi:hypothetical protein
VHSILKRSWLPGILSTCELEILYNVQGTVTLIIKSDTIGCHNGHAVVKKPEKDDANPHDNSSDDHAAADKCDNDDDNPQHKR